jgi:dCTP diphosphatase
MKNLDELKNMVVKFARDRDWDQFHSPKNLAMAVTVEAAELQEIFMWLTQDESFQLTAAQKSKVVDEVGDILICLVNFSAKLGIDPLEAAAQKIKKNHEKYPVDKSRGSAKKYDEL